MSQADVEVLRRLYDAAARRDAATVLGLYDPAVEFDYTHGPLRDLIGRRVYHGHEGIRRWFREWHEAWENVEYECEELIDGGDHVISVDVGRGRGRASGIELEAGQCAVWTIRRGRIVRVAWFPTREEAFRAAGLDQAG